MCLLIRDTGCTGTSLGGHCCSTYRAFRALPTYLLTYLTQMWILHFLSLVSSWMSQRINQSLPSQRDDVAAPYSTRYPRLSIDLRQLIMRISSCSCAYPISSPTYTVAS
ncbi:hypothetical protein LZ32DRAFT_67688 [Colletotrichum eremochloae]|nr:hypothetical protein LZ32DRAFT_67688 [Colletotrichum eremochloae]